MRSSYLIILLIALSIFISHVCCVPTPGGKKSGGSSEEEEEKGGGEEGGEEGGEKEEGGEEGGEEGKGKEEEEGAKEKEDKGKGKLKSEEESEEESNNEELERKQLAGELIRLEKRLDEAIQDNDHYDIRHAVYDIEKRIRPRMSYLSQKIEAQLTHVDQKTGDYKYQRGLLEDITRMMYKAGARSCLSPDETFYKPENGCIKFSAKAKSNPCANKTDQVLYDGKNNEGYCDCVLDERHLVYYNGSCYQQNIQGPCQKNAMLVLVEGKSTCLLNYGNCTTDQLYWSPDPSVPAECVAIGQKGPCKIGQVVTRDVAGVAICATPVDKLYAESAVKGKTKVVEQSSLWDPLPCPLGSFRYQNNKCPT